MTVFFDSDILLDVIESRNFPESGESLEICERLGFDIVTSWHSLANIYYLTRKRTHSEAKAVAVIEDLLNTVDVTGGAHREARRAIELNQGDYEDAMQLALAESQGADYLVTRNTSHYSLNSSVTVISPAAFLSRFGAGI